MTYIKQYGITLNHNLTFKLTYIKSGIASGQSVDRMRVKPDLGSIASPDEDQFDDTKEEQQLAPFAFIAVESNITVSYIFLLFYELCSRSTSKEMP
jgi:hypothetical protein